MNMQTGEQGPLYTKWWTAMTWQQDFFGKSNFAIPRPVYFPILIVLIVQCMFCLTFYRQAEGKMISTLIRRTKTFDCRFGYSCGQRHLLDGGDWSGWGLRGDLPKVDRKLMENSRAKPNGIKFTGVSHVRALQLDFLQ